MDRVSLVDIESTGVTNSDQVCEVAWKQIDYNFNVVAEGYSLINPMVPIPYAATAVNGITDEMVQGAPTLTEYMDSIGQPWLFSDVIFTAHNCSFDSRFLRDFIHPDAKLLCTLKCARRLYPDATNHKQATLAAMLGITVDRTKAHSADGDTDVLRQLLQKMCQDHDLGIDQLLHVQDLPLKVKTLKFGKKHFGKKIEDVPKDYIEWMLREVKNLDPDLRATLLAL
jgi:DNA polymerase III alpha subunit (gram-positive type)